MLWIDHFNPTPDIKERKNKRIKNKKKRKENRKNTEEKRKINTEEKKNEKNKLGKSLFIFVLLNFSFVYFLI